MELTKEENEILNIDSTYINGVITMIEGLQRRINEDNVIIREKYNKYLILKSDIEKDGLEFIHDYANMYNQNNFRFFDINSLKCSIRDIKNDIHKKQEMLDMKLKEIGDSKWVV